jgi:hypothetical protein
MDLSAKSDVPASSHSNKVWMEHGRYVDPSKQKRWYKQQTTQLAEVRLESP